MEQNEVGNFRLQDLPEGSGEGKEFVTQAFKNSTAKYKLKH
jgi:hypothetical protein